MFHSVTDDNNMESFEVLKSQSTALCNVVLKDMEGVYWQQFRYCG